MRTNYIAYTCILSALCVAAFFVGAVWSPVTHANAPSSVNQGLEPLPDMPAGKYNVDNVHSTAMFRVQHMGAGNFWGRFNDVKGDITFTPSDPEKTFEFAIDVDLDSVDSGNEKLDNHLKSPDFFNAKEYEKMSFKSTEIERLSQHVWDITGDLTMNGVTKSVVALVRFIGTADMGRGTRAGFDATFDIKRSDFNMNYGVENGTLGDKTHIVVALETVHDDS